MFNDDDNDVELEMKDLIQDMVELSSERRPRLLKVMVMLNARYWADSKGGSLGVAIYSLTADRSFLHDTIYIVW